MKNELLESMEATFATCLDIATNKNKDYAGDADPLANFNNSKAVGVEPERAILVRLMDKITRVSNLLDKEPAVVEESVMDTLEDAINYLAILKFIKTKG